MLDVILPILLDNSISVEAPPAYSSEPSCGEQRLELTPRQGRGGTLLTSTIVKRFGNVTLVLCDQEDGAQIASYGRSDVVSGVFYFDDPAKISQVNIQIHGELETDVTEFGTRKQRLVDDDYTLWKNDNNSSCPDKLTFSCILPTSYTESDERKSLPPSFHILIPSFRVKTYYHLSVEITCIRRSKLYLSSSVKRYTVPFRYYPRTRPNRPIVQTPCLLSSVKTLPEEWHQSYSTLKALPSRASCEPLHCNFFVPSVKIFGLKDTIPFHIQLTGPGSSLREFFPPDVLQRIATSDSSLSACPNFSGKKTSKHKDCVQVKLLQQVVVSNGDLKSWRDSTIGKGVVYPLPPSVICAQLPSVREESLDWEGYIKCNEDVTVGSFRASSIHVQHFISLTLTSPGTRRSQFQNFKIHVPVKLVSDSYSDFG